MTLIDSILQVIVRDRKLHARWLNTFSFLEYIGVRKIIKSQEAETLSLAILLHANEESRHALMLKKLALRMGGPGFDDYSSKNLICGNEAEAYFQTVDLAAEALQDSHRAYLAVTWLIEIRALEVYKSYLQALKLTPRNSTLETIEASLRALLKEEDRHLTDVESHSAFTVEPRPSWLNKLQAVEEKAYLHFLEHVAQSLMVQSPLECIHA